MNVSLAEESKSLAYKLLAKVEQLARVSLPISEVLETTGLSLVLMEGIAKGMISGKTCSIASSLS